MSKQLEKKWIGFSTVWLPPLGYGSMTHARHVRRTNYCCLLHECVDSSDSSSLRFTCTLITTTNVF